ncbi:MAG: CAP domain-containing protein [Actinomycetota bacterium]|jgi:uncharacterized protein YkwD
MTVVTQRTWGARLAGLTLAVLLGTGWLVGFVGQDPAHARRHRNRNRLASNEESSFRGMINGERVTRGVRTLHMGNRLVSIARHHSAAMAESNSLYHNPNLAQDLSSVQFSIAGENVGVGPTLPILHDAFMASPPHRENVLRPQFRKVGVGVVTGGDGRIWITIVFSG